MREWRITQGLSQAALAKQLGVSQPTVCALEGDKAILGELAAIQLQRLTGGAVKAADCVHPTKRQRLEEILNDSLQEPKGAA